jgi:hypothetical protein
MILLNVVYVSKGAIFGIRKVGTILSQIGGFVRVTYTTGFGLDVSIYRWSTHFTVHRCTRTLEFSVFTSRILTTDLSQSYCRVKSHMKASFHRLIHFLPLFCNWQFRRLDSIQFLSSQAHIPAGWRLETRLPSLNSLNWTLLYNHFAPTTLKTQLLCCWEGVFTTPLDCCLRIRCRRNVFTDSLPSNKRLFWLHYSGFWVSCHNICYRIVNH